MEVVVTTRYKTCKASVKMSPSTNLYRSGALPVAQPTVSKHSRDCKMENVNVNVNLYSASSQKNNASNALDVLSTVQKETSSLYDENGQFACPGHADCFGTSSMSLVQRQRRCDGGTYGAETVEQRVVDGGWRNEDAVVQQLRRPVYIAQTGNPVPGHASTCIP